MMMRNLFTATTILSATFLLTACGRTQLPTSPYRSMPVSVRAQSSVQQAPVQLIVRFRKDVTRTALQEFNKKYQLQTVNYLPQLDAYMMVLRAPVTSQAALSAMVNNMQNEAVTTLVEVNHEMAVSPVRPEMSISPIISR